MGGRWLDPHCTSPQLLLPYNPQMVEWDMLLFFCAMFIMVEGAVELGLIDRIAQLLQLIIDTAPASARKVCMCHVCLDSIVPTRGCRQWLCLSGADCGCAPLSGADSGCAPLVPTVAVCAPLVPTPGFNRADSGALCLVLSSWSHVLNASCRLDPCFAPNLPCPLFCSESAASPLSCSSDCRH